MLCFSARDDLVRFADELSCVDCEHVAIASTRSPTRKHRLPGLSGIFWDCKPRALPVVRRSAQPETFLDGASTITSVEVRELTFEFRQPLQLRIARRVVQQCSGNLV